MIRSCYAYASVEKQSLDELVSRHAPLVKRIAHHLSARLPDSVQVDDLIQSGMIGLIEAANKYDGEKGASFETYAGIRIRGAMLDEIRQGDWAPRSVYRNSRKISDAIAQVESSKGGVAEDLEVAETLGVSLQEYHAMLQDSAGCKLFSLEEITDNPESGVGAIISKSDDPSKTVEQKHFQARLVEAIKGLPEREQLILSLYYDEELNLKEIGAVLGVSESRVCQLHSQAVARLNTRLKEWN